MSGFQYEASLTEEETEIEAESGQCFTVFCKMMRFESDSILPIIRREMASLATLVFWKEPNRCTLLRHRTDTEGFG